MKVALYKGRTRLFDRLIQWWTRSEYSHCEAVVGELPDGTMACWSSSSLDGGVRLKLMKLDPARWDIVEVEADVRLVDAWFQEREGRSYDYRGLIGCALRFLPASDDKWFCSSAVAAAMGWPEHWRFVPANFRNAADFQRRPHGIA